MGELELLKSMWASKVKRKTDLIVPQIICSGGLRSLSNNSWVFSIPFAFRAALDIKHEQRMKNKKAYMVWTQGPFLSFKEGDLIHSQDKLRALQIKEAKPIFWDVVSNEMNQGYLLFDECKLNNDVVFEVKQYTCTQMQFLELIIYGFINNFAEQLPVQD